MENQDMAKDRVDQAQPAEDTQAQDVQTENQDQVQAEKQEQGQEQEKPESKPNAKAKRTEGTTLVKLQKALGVGSKVYAFSPEPVEVQNDVLKQYKEGVDYTVVK